MSIWIILWLAVSAALIIFLFWTFYVLLNQKTVWKQFAKKYKLRYKNVRMMDAPEMNGVIDNYKVSFFPSEHATNDMRGTRSLTAIEIPLESKLPVEGVVASGGMVAIAHMLDFGDEWKPSIEGWSDENVALTNDRLGLKHYLTETRLKVLMKCMKIKGAWLMFAFKGDTVLLRVDVNAPLSTLKELEHVKNTLLKTAKVLELEDGEYDKIASAKTKTSSAAIALEVDDDVELVTGLTLEEDDESEEITEPEMKEE